jgi:hypothetical protein
VDAFAMFVETLVDPAVFVGRTIEQVFGALSRWRCRKTRGRRISPVANLLGADRLCGWASSKSPELR